MDSADASGVDGAPGGDKSEVREREAADRRAALAAAAAFAERGSTPEEVIEMAAVLYQSWLAPKTGAFRRTVEQASGRWEMRLRRP